MSDDSPPVVSTDPAISTITEDLWTNDDDRRLNATARLALVTDGRSNTALDQSVRLTLTNRWFILSSLEPPADAHLMGWDASVVEEVYCVHWLKLRVAFVRLREFPHFDEFLVFYATETNEKKNDEISLSEFLQQLCQVSSLRCLNIPMHVNILNDWDINSWPFPLKFTDAAKHIKGRVVMNGQTSVVAEKSVNPMVRVISSAKRVVPRQIRRTLSRK